MNVLELAIGVFALGCAVALGTMLHELLHAAVLRAAGVPFDVRWPQDRGATRLHAGLVGALASVELRAVPPDLSPWQLRLASMAPLALALPLAAVAFGIVPDPFATGHLVAQLAVVGWLACAIPSPQDFSLFWYAADVIDGTVEPGEA